MGFDIPTEDENVKKMTFYIFKIFFSKFKYTNGFVCISKDLLNIYKEIDELEVMNIFNKLNENTNEIIKNATPTDDCLTLIRENYWTFFPYSKGRRLIELVVMGSILALGDDYFAYQEEDSKKIYIKKKDQPCYVQITINKDSINIATQAVVEKVKNGIGKLGWIDGQEIGYYSQRNFNYEKFYNTEKGWIRDLRALGIYFLALSNTNYQMSSSNIIVRIILYGLSFAILLVFFLEMKLFK